MFRHLVQSSVLLPYLLLSVLKFGECLKHHFNHKGVNHGNSFTNELVNPDLHNPLRSNFVQVSKNMFLLFKRINIFLLSFFLIFAPVTNFAYAIDPIVPPFTSAPAAADVAAALGAGETGGFAAGLAGVGIAAAAIGVGVGSFCLASAIQGANSCGVNSAICNALTGAMISCNPNPDGSFPKATSSSPKPPDGGHYLYNIRGANGTPLTYVPIGTVFGYIANFKTYGGCGIKTSNIQLTNTTEPYGAVRYTVDWDGLPPVCYGFPFTTEGGLDFINSDHVVPKDPSQPPVSPTDVGKAIAGNPAAAAAVGSAAAAAANAGCNGTLGTFNGVSTCVPALGPSNNPSCTGFSGVVNGQVACAHAAADPNSGACAGMFVTVNGINQCVSDAGTANPACSAKLAVLSNSFICIGSDATPSYDAQKASADAFAAAQAAAAHPPLSRSCASTMQLDTSGICVNPALPNPQNSSCNKGYVHNGSTCVPADPLNPSIPASTTPVTAAQATANAAAAAASKSLSQSRANSQAATATATANPTTANKAAATAAAAALQQATLEAVAANTAATAQATAQPKPMELPAFCGWAAIVCDAITWAKTDAKAPTDTAVTVKSDIPSEIQNLDINKSYFNFGAQCPADVPVTFSLMGKSTTLNIKYTLLCDFLSKLRPFVIGSAWIAGAFIISGASRSGGGDS